MKIHCVTKIINLVNMSLKMYSGSISYTFLLFLFEECCMSTATYQANQKPLPLWTWECLNERCVPSRATQTSKLQSIASCNMLCGSLQLWPQPTGGVTLASSAVPTRVDLMQLRIKSTSSKAVNEYLRDAFNLMRDDLRIMERLANGFAEWRSLIVRVTVNGSEDPRLKLNTDESYKLVLRRNTKSRNSLVVNIYGRTFCDARHAFETLTQLIWLDAYTGSLMILEEANVEDKPRFRYRGLMLDTATNYFPVSDILRTIDAMAASKLNTFHWHACDSQSFSLNLTSVPELSEHGVYSPGIVYTPEDIQTVVDRASLRGIRVIIEIDVPAFENVSHCLDATATVLSPYGQLNPRSPDVFKLLERIYAEIVQLTSVDDVFHLGGNDISKTCWTDGINSSYASELSLLYTKSVLDRLESVNGKLPNLTLFWLSKISDRLKTDLKNYVPNIGLQTRCSSWALNVVSGMRTVASYEDAWDLNSGFGTWYAKGDGAPYNSWQRVYEHRPWLHETQIIEGGEATVWSLTLSPGGLDARIWPRAAAFAERLWSDRAEGATMSVQARLDMHRSRLVSRGVQAAPLFSMWCSHNPFTCV